MSTLEEPWRAEVTTRASSASVGGGGTTLARRDIQGDVIAPHTASAAAWRRPRASAETSRCNRSVESRSRSARRSAPPEGEPSNEPTASFMALALAASLELALALAIALSSALIWRESFPLSEALPFCDSETSSSKRSHWIRLPSVSSVARSVAMPSALPGERERRTAQGMAIS